jgi:hypothetical protein
VIALVGALIAVFFWHLRALGAVLFVVFYPIVVIFWKLPNFAHKLRLDRNWIFWMLLFQGVIAGFRNLRFIQLAATFGLASALVIILFAEAYFLVPAGIVLVALLIWTVARVVTASMRTSSFLTSQNEALDAIGSLGDRFVKLELPSRPAGGALTPTDVQNLSFAISVQLVANRALYLWAYKLQQYRQSSLGLMLSLAGYCLLFVGSVFTLGLLNLALVKRTGPIQVLDLPLGVVDDALWPVEFVPYGRWGSRRGRSVRLFAPTGRWHLWPLTSWRICSERGHHRSRCPRGSRSEAHGLRATGTRPSPRGGPRGCSTSRDRRGSSANAPVGLRGFALRVRLLQPQHPPILPPGRRRRDSPRGPLGDGSSQERRMRCGTQRTNRTFSSNVTVDRAIPYALTVLLVAVGVLLLVGG